MPAWSSQKVQAIAGHSSLEEASKQEKLKKKKKDLFPNTCIGTEQKKNLMPTVKSIALEFSM